MKENWIFFLKRQKTRWLGGRSGFTLIEVIIVIAILGILVSALLIVINPSQKLAEARDAKRIADLKQIGTSLNAFYTIRGYYPAVTCTYQGWERSEYPGDTGDCTGNKSQFMEYLPDGGWIKLVPIDPQHPLNSSTNGYLYQDQNGGRGFCLLAHLENSNNSIVTNDSNCDDGFPAPYGETWWYAIGNDK